MNVTGLLDDLDREAQGAQVNKQVTEKDFSRKGGYREQKSQ